MGMGWLAVCRFLETTLRLVSKKRREAFASLR